MENQVLPLKQMQELQELGIDTSKASMLWSYDELDDILLSPKTKGLNIYEHQIPTFTLQDILERLPSFLYDKYTEKDAPLYLGKYENQYYISYDTMTIDEDEDNLYPHMETRTYNAPVISFGLYHTPLEAAFCMLKWCKQNNYI